MRSQKRVSGLVLAAIALQLSVVPVQLNAFRAPDEQKGVQNMKKSDSLQSLHLKRVLQNNLQKKVGGNTILAVEDLVQNIFNSGISNALTKVSGNSNANVTSSSMSHKLQSGTTLSIASIRQTQTDNLGFKHIRVSQEYKDLPVVGAEIIVHINNNDNIYMINGKYQPDLNIDTKPSVSQNEALSVGTTEQKDKENMRVGQKPSLVIYNAKLTWFYIIEHDGKNPGQWYYYIDAKTGKKLNYYNNIKYAAPSQGNGSAASVTGNRLSGENGHNVTIDGFKESSSSNNYFLYSFANAWGVYDTGVSDWEQQATSAWSTHDPAAVSCGHNFETTQNYVSTVLGRNSFDDSGAFARADIHVGTNMVNAYWDGSKFNFGDGDGSTANALTVLDVSAHEYGHAITQNTSNLVYQDESGALNEAYSDIIGTAVEWRTQSDGTGAYPNADAGKADWLIGEDCWLSDTALRDMRDPQRYNQPSYYHGTHWYSGTGDHGGVHTNSGVANFAYYLLAAGGSGSNDGHAYNITGIGEAHAAEVALRANYHYHTSTATYADARTAWMQAATDLGYNAQTVADVWTACGVEEVIPCHAGYSHDDTVTYNFEDISTSGTNLNLSDDSVATVTMPFDFNFYCGTYNSVNISSNGTLSFTSNLFDLSNECIPSDDFSDLIAALWDDLNPGSGGAVYWQVLGTSPNQRLVIQWNDVPRWSDTGDATFQVILYEDSNNILFQYKDVDFGDADYDFGASATVGIQQNDTNGIQYSCDTASLSNNLAILFTPILILDNPSSDPIGLAYDASRNGVWATGEFDGKIYMIDTVSYATVKTISLAGKVTNPDGYTNGIAVLSNGNLLLADYNGDQNTIDDNIFEFNPDTETMVNYWPLDGSWNTSTDGTHIDRILGIAKAGDNHIYVTSLANNNIYKIALAKGNPGTWSTVSVSPAPVVVNAAGIDSLDGAGLAISDWYSTTVGIVDNASKVISQFSFTHSGNTRNTGVTLIPGSTEQLWVTDFHTRKIGIFDLPKDSTPKKFNMSPIYYLLLN